MSFILDLQAIERPKNAIGRWDSCDDGCDDGSDGGDCGGSTLSLLLC